MASNAVLFFIVLHLGCSVVHPAFASEHETVSSETSIEGNIEVSKYSAKPDVAETVPKICPVGFGCGYQIYNQSTRKTRRFVEYCTCPEDASCLKVGDNVMYHLYYYQCQKNLDDIWMPTHSSTTELPDILDSVKLTSDMQDCTEEFMNRAYTTAESTIKHKLKEIVQPSGPYQGFYKISASTTLNQEQDSGSYERSNTGFKIPIYTPGSTGSLKLYEIAELFDGANYSAAESDCSTSEGQNDLNSLVNESPSVDDVTEVTYEISADTGIAVNVHNGEQSYLDNPVSNVESTTVELPLGKDEL